jgi:hypothetical protein
LAHRDRGILVDVGAFDLADGEFLGAVDRGAQRMAVEGVAGQRSSVQYELAAGRSAVGGDDSDPRLSPCVTRPVPAAASNSHSLAACDGCATIPLRRARAQEGEASLINGHLGPIRG